jgi:hypothetical protein
MIVMSLGNHANGLSKDSAGNLIKSCACLTSKIASPGSRQLYASGHGLGLVTGVLGVIQGHGC